MSLASEGFDLAIRHCRRELLPETHVAWPLCRTATLVVASADYIRRFGRPDSPDALRQHQCLTYPRGPQSPHWTFERDDERVSVKVQGPFATNNSESLRDAVLAGLGVALLPDFSARRRLAAGWFRSCCRDGGRWMRLRKVCTSFAPTRRAYRGR